MNADRQAFTVGVLALLRRLSGLVGDLSSGRIRRGRLIFGHDRQHAIDDLQETFLFVHLYDFDVRVGTLV